MLKKVLRNFNFFRLHEKEENDLMVLNKFVGKSLWYITERENGVCLRFATNICFAYQNLFGAICHNNESNNEIFCKLVDAFDKSQHLVCDKIFFKKHISNILS